jgi:hypothetical protein
MDVVKGDLNIAHSCHLVALFEKLLTCQLMVVYLFRIDSVHQMKTSLSHALLVYLSSTITCSQF